MLRPRSNCNVMLVWPRELEEVISVTPATRPTCRSSGVATADAMISGLAPGNDADTDTVGKSTCGRGETGSNRNATAPASPTAIVRSAVPTGRLINGDERLTLMSFRRRRCSAWAQSCFRILLAARPAVPPTGKARGHGVEEQINHWRRVERQKLAQQQAADNRDPERPAKL